MVVPPVLSTGGLFVVLSGDGDNRHGLQEVTWSKEEEYDKSDLPDNSSNKVMIATTNLRMKKPHKLTSYSRKEKSLFK